MRKFRLKNYKNFLHENEILLNGSLDFLDSTSAEFGGFIVILGENNIGKSNILNALNTFNEIDSKLRNLDSIESKQQILDSKNIDSKIESKNTNFTESKLKNTESKNTDSIESKSKITKQKLQNLDSKNSIKNKKAPSSMNADSIESKNLQHIESNLLKDIKPNFKQYENEKIILGFEYKVKKNFGDEIAGKTFCIYPTQSVLDYGVEKNQRRGVKTHKDYQQMIQKILDSNTLSALHGTDANQGQKARNEIKIFAHESDFVIFLSPLEGGNKLKCFSIVCPNPTKIHLKDSIKIDCKFKLCLNDEMDENTASANNERFDNAEIFRNYIIQKSQEKYRHISTIQPKIEYSTYTNSLIIDSKGNVRKDNTLPQNIIENYGFYYMPNIIFYKQVKLDSKDLLSDISEIIESKFFNALFKAINYDIHNIKRALERYENSGDIQDLRDEENAINAKIKDSIQKQFNTLYYHIDKGIYEFQIILESTRAQFGIKKDGNSITLSQQSSGFTWFFNFFFNFINTQGGLQKGDIVLLDEVETHFSIPAQKELRNFLCKFGMAHGVLFVATTHSPYFVNLDNLEDVRIVKKADFNSVKIVNDFALLNTLESNALEEILKALGANFFSVVDNIDMKLIFVEGIIDYCYLNAFKSAYFKEKNKKLNLCFMPIGGLHTNDEEQKRLESMLLNIAKYTQKKPLILVDSDKAAKRAKEIMQDSQVILIKEVLKDKFDIESLFSKNDKIVFDTELKSSALAKRFKKLDLSLKAQAQSKENFYTLLEYLERI